MNRNPPSRRKLRAVTSPRAATMGLALLCAVADAASVRAQQAPPSWVALYDQDQLGWLENENRLGELCADPETLDGCYARVLAPRVSVHRLYAAPDSTSRHVGDLVVVATPGRGLSAHYRAPDASRALPFVPDLFLQDWGYGPYLHQTVTARSGRWYALPRGPWPEAVWLVRPGAPEWPQVIPVQAGDLIEYDGAGWYVIAANADGLTLRAEQPADHWCEEGDPPPLAPAEAVSVPSARLYDVRGHLALRPKYLKGC